MVFRPQRARVDAVWLIKQGIRAVRAVRGIRKTTVERFHGAIEAAVRHRRAGADWAEWLAHFRREQRGRTKRWRWRPQASRWQRSERAYQPQPPALCGGDGQAADRAGCLWEGGRHWFVSEALAGEWVGLTVAADDCEYVRVGSGCAADASAGTPRGLRAVEAPSALRASTANPQPPQPSQPPSPGTEGGNDVL